MKKGRPKGGGWGGGKGVIIWDVWGPKMIFFWGGGGGRRRHLCMTPKYT